MEKDKFENALGFLRDLMKGVIDELPEDIAKPMRKVLEFRKTLNIETDRGCALMSAAFLDEKLADLLKAFLVEDNSVVKSLFSFNGPFGTFFSRIDAAYALGLIPGNVRKDVHLLRKIRNDFAHVSCPLTFNDEPIVSRCRELYLDGKDNTSQPRGKFTRSMMSALGVIEVSMQKLERRKVMEDHEIALNQKGIDSLNNLLRKEGMQDLVELVR